MAGSSVSQLHPGREPNDVARRRRHGSLRSRIAPTDDAVDTRYGTHIVSTILARRGAETSPRMSASPWLMAISTVPTPAAYSASAGRQKVNGRDESTRWQRQAFDGRTV